MCRSLVASTASFTAGVKTRTDCDVDELPDELELSDLRTNKMCVWMEGKFEFYTMFRAELYPAEGISHFLISSAKRFVVFGPPRTKMTSRGLICWTILSIDSPSDLPSKSMNEMLHLMSRATSVLTHFVGTSSPGSVHD